MSRQLFRYHPNIGYTFIPGLRTRVASADGGYLLRVNQAGFRSDREFEREKPAGVRRVLLFGDSFTAADGVSNKKRYSDVLETLVAGLEVYNFGLPGTGTDQQYVTFREFAGQYEHDQVVVAVLVENIRRVAAKYRTYATSDGQTRILAKPYFRPGPGGDLIRHHYPVPREPLTEEDLPEDQRPHVDRGGRFEVLRKAVNKLGPWARDVAQHVTHYQPLPAYEAPDNPDWLLMKAILTAWIRESANPVVIFPLPLYQHVEETADPSGYQQRFRELAEETGARLHDPMPDYLQTPRSERRRFRFGKDIHPTPASHELLAASLARCVRELAGEPVA